MLSPMFKLDDEIYVVVPFTVKLPAIVIVSLLSPIVAVPKFALSADLTFAVVAYLLVEPSDKS